MVTALFCSLLAWALPNADAGEPLRVGVLSGRIDHGPRIDVGVGYPALGLRLAYAHRNVFEVRVAPRLLYFDPVSYMLGGGAELTLRGRLTDGPAFGAVLAWSGGYDTGAWIHSTSYERYLLGPLAVESSFGRGRFTFDFGVGALPAIIRYQSRAAWGDLNLHLPKTVVRLTGQLAVGFQARVSARVVFGFRGYGEGGAEAWGTYCEKFGCWDGRGGGGFDAWFAVATRRVQGG